MTPSRKPPEGLLWGCQLCSGLGLGNPTGCAPHPLLGIKVPATGPQASPILPHNPCPGPSWFWLVGGGWVGGKRLYSLSSPHWALGQSQPGTPQATAPLSTQSVWGSPRARREAASQPGQETPAPTFSPSNNSFGALDTERWGRKEGGLDNGGHRKATGSPERLP